MKNGDDSACDEDKVYLRDVLSVIFSLLHCGRRTASGCVKLLGLHAGSRQSTIVLAITPDGSGVLDDFNFFGFSSFHALDFLDPTKRNQMKCLRDLDNHRSLRCENSSILQSRDTFVPRVWRSVKRYTREKELAFAVTKCQQKKELTNVMLKTASCLASVSVPILYVANSFGSSS